MKRWSSIFAVLLAAAGMLSAQQQQPAAVDSAATALDHMVEVYRKENIPFKKPIPLAHVREADVPYERTVWRMVELTEKNNLPLYYPTAPIGSRLNFISVLLKGIELGEITPYDPNDDHNEFVRPITKEEIDRTLGARRDSIEVEDEFGNVFWQPRVSEIQVDQIKRLMIKEKIFFDKRHSVLNMQVIGICPIRVYSRDGGDGSDGSPMEQVKVMWIYMPEARDILARHPIFNRFNDAQNISFDDFFIQNRYAGNIFKISNVYNNRTIDEYAQGLDALYEAMRIEMEIFDWEQDLWEY